MISPKTTVVGVPPRIDTDRFTQILQQHGSPAAAEGAACYRAVASQQVDPLFALAIFWHESQFGTQGVCATYGMRNPGNTRSSRTGVGTVIQTEKGTFVQYPTWEEGFRDLAFRLVDPTFLYAQEGRRTIQQIIERWAPPADGNDPSAYVQAVVAFMNQNEGTAQMAELWYPPAQRVTSPYQDRGADYGRQWPGTVTHVVMHHTVGNWDSVVHEFTGGSRQVSAHFLVGRDGRVAQFVSLADIAWHAGNWDMNVKSIGIEHEQVRNPDGSWTPWTDVQLTASANLLAWLFAQAGRPLTVIRHRDVIPTECPGDLPVEQIVAMAQQAQPPQAAPAPPPAEGQYVEDGGRRTYRVGGKLVHLGGGFLAYYRWLEQQLGAADALLLIGLPLTDELQEDGVTVQYFERAVFEWRPGQRPERWDVLLRRLGAEVAKAKGYLT